MLRDIEQDFYKKSFPAIAGAKPPASDLKNRNLKRTLAEEMYRGDSGHPLCRFARKITEFEYAIEEQVTSNHIYFFQENGAEAFYDKYTRHHGGGIQCRVLRVKSDAVNHLEKDQAEEKGYMTRESVLPGSIEIYNAEGNPFHSGEEEKWLSIATAAES
ncbi:hypothetical protein [Erwinia psidii]|uniref:Uncharacterized protein n=1 Tax=Erwinia psidii TaxID=69224 RepID=A0A3N6RVF8_9GAMM|nr:hypothetical protein [Erwinia psidii]MCX8959389.1 hypothetical protein [Erwinia psidii]MCX8962645.1 hypothetical protein [Erwinia psidii]MCX8964241.1 hypothetical protein [Erwinia psidii]RQM36924.1 hypothetical protein EB241_18375 [Erwinia psidii]